MFYVPGLTSLSVVVVFFNFNLFVFYFVKYWQLFSFAFCANAHYATVPAISLLFKNTEVHTCSEKIVVVECNSFSLHLFFILPFSFFFFFLRRVEHLYSMSILLECTCSICLYMQQKYCVIWWYMYQKIKNKKSTWCLMIKDKMEKKNQPVDKGTNSMSDWLYNSVHVCQTGLILIHM